MLYAPGSEERKMRKALQLDADAVIFDLEDAVAAAHKDRARILTRKLIDEVHHEPNPLPPVFVRINDASTSLGKEDLDAVVVPGLVGVKLPKVDTVEQLVAAAELVAALERKRGLDEGAVVLIPGIESPTGVLNARGLAHATERTLALSFGATDYSRTLGSDPSRDFVETIVPLSLLAMASADANIGRPIDSAFTNIGDLDGLSRSAELARSLGFQGKAVIHPSQVETVNRVFSPSLEEVNRAGRLVDAYNASDGAVIVDMGLVDTAHVRRARDVLALDARLREAERAPHS